MLRTEQEREVFLFALKVGRMLLESGAEVFRVEETIKRICQYYGLESAEPFVLSNGVFLTMGDQREAQFAKVIHVPVNNSNLAKVVELNELSRQIVRGNYTLEEAKQQLVRIEQLKNNPVPLRILLGGISTGCFSILFGGGIKESIAAFVIGVILYAFLAVSRDKKLSKIVCNITGSALVSALCTLTIHLGLADYLQPLMVGCIMLLVPGMAFVNGIRDFANGDYIAGSVRLTDSLLVFGCIAIGVGVVFSLYQGITGGVLL